MTRPVYLVDGARTPFLKARGRPGPFTPVDLAVQAGRPLLMRQPFAATRLISLTMASGFQVGSTAIGMKRSG